MRFLLCQHLDGATGAGASKATSVTAPGWAQHPTSGSAPMHSIPCQLREKSMPAAGGSPHQMFSREAKASLAAKQKEHAGSTSPVRPRHPEPLLHQCPRCLHQHLFKWNLHLLQSQQMGKSVVWAEINLLKLSEE